jgi:hypothetical protein
MGCNGLLRTRRAAFVKRHAWATLLNLFTTVRRFKVDLRGPPGIPASPWAACSRRARRAGFSESVTPPKPPTLEEIKPTVRRLWNSHQRTSRRQNGVCGPRQCTASTAMFVHPSDFSPVCVRPRLPCLFTPQISLREPASLARGLNPTEMDGHPCTGCAGPCLPPMVSERINISTAAGRGHRGIHTHTQELQVDSSH